MKLRKHLGCMSEHADGGALVACSLRDEVMSTNVGGYAVLADLK